MTELSAELREMAERAGLITWAITDDIRGGHETNLAAFARLIAGDCLDILYLSENGQGNPYKLIIAKYGLGMSKYAPRD